MRTKLTLSISLAAMAGLTACATQAALPSNVFTRASSDGGTYIDKVDFSYSANEAQDFSKLKLCVAENITNDPVTLQDSSDSFVGAYTGNYYRNSNTQIISGQGVFKYVDDKASALIATGSTISNSNQLIPVKDIVKFDMKSSLVGSKVNIVFMNITRAQKETGAIANDGFAPVGTWYGARSQDIYTSIEVVANKIKSCMK
ncbi:MAG: hypothetical protein BVN34_08405 [Proteobacteria bacterium ST_bin12]|nr:MAG: hypothetical protein BVN34_08405 [Proteobacteria bacterium ST_bin12]